MAEAPDTWFGSLTNTVLSAGVAIILAACGFVARMLHGKFAAHDTAMADMAERITAVEKAASEAARNADSEIWKALETHRAESQRHWNEIYRSMVSKEDLRSMEERLVAAFVAARKD